MSTDPQGSTPGLPSGGPVEPARRPGGRRVLRRPGARSLERLSDKDLVDLTRTGAVEPFEVLWHRHADAGRRVASRFTRASETDDLVQEAYVRIYAALSRGSGPVGPFRPYLYQAIRNIAITWAARPQADSVELVGDLSDGTDITESVLEGTVTASAFRSLPARWQEVLWYSEVEGLEPAELGPLLGMKASAVSALAYRAREGLRRAWLQAHVSSAALPQACRWSAERMGAANRGALGGAARTRFDEHVGSCTRCTILVSEIDEVARRLGLVLVPLLVGVPWATFQYWGAPSTAAASVGAVAARSGSRPAARGGHAGRGRHIRLAVAVVAAVAAVSTAAALGEHLLRTSTESTPQATAAPEHTPTNPAPLATPSTSPEAKEPDDAGEAAEADPEASAAVEPSRSTEPSELDLEGPPDPPLPRPGPTEPLPALPTLPPAPPPAPVPPVVTPTSTPPDPTVPTAPTAPTAPAVPTLTGPPAGTPLATFPTVSGRADPGVTVVLSATSGDTLTTTVAKDDGSWSTPVCQDSSTAPAACLADTDSLTVQAHARDETTDLESAASPGLSWTFDRPTMTEPTDGAQIVLPESGDVAVQLDGAAGSTVQVSIDGVPTGHLHTMPQAEELEWRDVTPGAHTLSVRYVTVGADGTTTTGHGPTRTVTVTVVEP